MGAIRTIALPGNHTPRQCGIATFTTHLGESVSAAFPDLDCFVLAMNDGGDVANVTFPCGYTIAPDGDTIYLYYGAADTSIALATGSVRELLHWLDDHGSGDPHA